MSDTVGQDQQQNMRRVALTSLAGTSIEWYDFFLYATAAAVIFPIAFFPQEDPTTALLISFSSLAVGFLARPLGGIVFGHFGDRIGRKRTLVVALMMMGITTTLIGFLPTYASIGIAAPALLVLLRFVQGLAIGGQWGGAMLLVTESAPANQRGWYGAYAQAGAPIGVVLANLAFIGVSSSMSDESFMDWGWRLPFIASIVLIGISMYIQLKIEDTEAFRSLSNAQSEVDKPPVTTVKRSPVIEAIRKYPKRIMLAAGAFLSVQVTFYILIAFVISYGMQSPNLMLSKDLMLTAVLVAAAIMVPTQFYFSGLSDKIGRKNVYRWGAILTGVWGFALFPLIDTGNTLFICLAITMGLLFLGMQYGPQAAYFTELFSTEVRYSGASLGYQIGAILGGALAPTIAVLLWDSFGIFYVSVYIAIAALLTLWSLSQLEETKGNSL